MLISKRNLIASFLKIKIKSHGDEVTEFYNKKIPRLDSHRTCLAVISLHFTLKKYENYYPQVFLRKCKYTEKKVSTNIENNLSDFSSDDDSDDSDDE